MNDNYDSIMSELSEIKQEEDLVFQNDVISSTIVQLLEIEKKTLYGNMRGKTKQQDNIILEGLKRFKETRNADS